MKLIALVDNSMYAPSVCDYAAWFANRVDAGIALIHVLDRKSDAVDLDNLSGSIGLGARTELLEELVELDARKAKLSHKLGRAILEDARQRVLDSASAEGEIATRLRNGNILEAIETFEAEAELIVIGKRGEAADFDKLLPGSNLESVVRHCKRPVLVASRAFKPVNRFLIAFDGGSSVNKAINYLAEHPAFADIECELMAVTSNPSEIKPQLEAAELKLRNAGYTVTSKIESGLPETVIAREVETDGYDLLIMGAFGHSRFRNMIVGSTTTEMIRACKIPILMLH